jgi:hypothetical protein
MYISHKETMPFKSLNQHQVLETTLKTDSQMLYWLHHQKETINKGVDVAIHTHKAKVTEVYDRYEKRGIVSNVIHIDEVYRSCNALDTAIHNKRAAVNRAVTSYISHITDASPYHD